MAKNCDSYASDVAQYENLVAETVADIEVWLQREADLALSKRALDQAVKEAADSRWWTDEFYEKSQGLAAFITIGVAVAGLIGTIAIGPAIAFGVASIALTCGSDWATAEDFQGLIEGRLKAERRWLDTRDGYIGAEIGRLRRFKDVDLGNRYNELNTRFSSCAGTEGISPPQSPTIFEPNRPIGRIAHIEEIRTWR